jgi:hypothetical protein
MLLFEAEFARRTGSPDTLIYSCNLMLSMTLVRSAIILITILSAISFASAYECNDTDGGQDFYLKGYVTFGPTKAVDTCNPDSQTGEMDLLLETYCLGIDEGIGLTEGIGYYWVKCTYGCFNGSCNSSYETMPCEDSDGDDTFIKGNITSIPAGFASDCCQAGEAGSCVQSGRYVKELTCGQPDDFGYTNHKEIIECPNGCFDGVCLADDACLTNCTISGAFSAECEGLNGCTAEQVASLKAKDASDVTDLPTPAPTCDCDDSDPSTLDSCADGLCGHAKITSCINDDRYCPTGCLRNTDSDCPECQSDEECEDGDSCSDNLCEAGKCTTEKNSGCDVNGTCLALGRSANGKYCAEDGMANQKAKGALCTGDPECVSGLCSKGTCREKGIFTRFFDWVTGLV